MKLEPALIRNFAQHHAIDPLLFSFCLEVLNHRKLRVRVGPDAEAPLRRVFDKLFWAPGERMIHVTRARPTISANDLLHIATHELFFERHGQDLEQDPGISLLAEAMASCAEMLWTFRMSRHERLTSAAVQKNLRLVLSPQERRTFANLYRASAITPVAVYQRLVLGFLQLCEVLWHQHRRQRRGQLGSRGPVIRALRKTSLPWLIQLFDFPNNVFFVSAYFRRPLSPRGFAAVQRRARALTAPAAWVDVLRSISNLGKP